MLAFSLLNVILLSRFVFRRRRVLEKDVEGPLELNEAEDPILIDVANLEETRIVRGRGDGDVPVNEVRVDAVIQPLLDAAEPDACKYCFIFQDLSSMVCPNCGRLLKVTPLSV
jgi:hypothetical protein